MIAQSRLIEIRNLAAADSTEPFKVHSHEMVAICDELMRYRDASMRRAHGTHPNDEIWPEHKPTPVEEKHEDLWKRTNKLQADLDARITKVAELIGERISGLVDETAAVRDSAVRAHERLDEVAAGREIVLRAFHQAKGVKFPDAPDLERFARGVEHGLGELLPAFPTGGAHTAEVAADAVLPVPQRGDRVRLEEAKTLFGTPLRNGWWPVLGQMDNAFQVGQYGDTGAGPVYWVRNDHPGLKEVRQHPFTKETDNVVD